MLAGPYSTIPEVKLRCVLQSFLRMQMMRCTASFSFILATSAAGSAATRRPAPASTIGPFHRVAIAAGQPDQHPSSKHRSSQHQRIAFDALAATTV
ncbi:unnamed protein product [Tilletia caries]|nr:unnamed protein product [Tilletia caries]CAD6939646.1 unnamed protein product [Tilletia controversa]